MTGRLKEDRSFWQFVLLGILTLGIYGIVFMYGMVRDWDTACSRVEDASESAEKSPGYITVILLTCVTLGIYYFFWIYRQGNRIQRCGQRYGLTIAEGGGSYLAWTTIGCLLFYLGPLIMMGMLIGNVNRLCKCYNKKNEQERLREKDPGEKPGEKPGEQPKEESIFGAKGQICGLKGAYAGGVIEICPGESLLAGRDPSICQLVLKEGDISRKHCEISLSGDGNYYLTDYSSFGVYINGSYRLEKGIRTKCPPGTKLSLASGDNQFVLR